MNKINVIPIILGHVKTLQDNSTGRISVQDTSFFFGLPFLLAAIAFYCRWSLSVDALNAVLASFAIFAGLLLNLLILVYTFSSDTVQPSALAKVRGTVIRELHDNISYAVLISIIIVVLALAAIGKLRISDGQATSHYTDRYMSFFIIYFTLNFVLTLLMILKRIHKILSQRFDQYHLRSKAS
jgi:hypothetical protein